MRLYNTGCRFIVGTFAFMSTVYAASGVQAQTILTEGWETPAIPDGATTSNLPVGWQGFGGFPNIRHPSGTAEFNQTDPLAPPAEGSQLLALSGVNVGIDKVMSSVIQPGSIYTLSAAIGSKKVNASDSWSLQLWADTNNNGVFDGSSGDTFIGQQFGTSGSATIPTAGNWALNSYSSVPVSDPTLLGKRLIVFLNNFGSGATYYDNVSVRVTASATPEPGSIALLAAVVLMGTGCLSRRRKRASS